MNMMNKVMIMGRMTADPELKFTQANGFAVCTFSIAVDRPYRKDAEKEADFFRVVAWRNTAEYISKYFHKGDLVNLMGRLHNNKYTAEGETQPRIVTEIIVDELYYAGARRKAEDAAAEAAETTVESGTLSGVDLSEFEEICSGEDVPF